VKPRRPYFLRALYDWIVDSGETPYVLVDATVAGVQVPSEYVEDGKIVLNMSPDAVRDLDLDTDYVSCSSRFGGKHFPVHLPMASIQAIYCKANGQGMAFEPEEFGDLPSDDEPDGTDPDGGKPRLRLVP
jgi:stringent starvation protein B